MAIHDRHKKLLASAPAVVPANVQRTVCQPNIDTRLQVDPATFQGGEFMADWRAKRSAPVAPKLKPAKAKTAPKVFGA